MAGNISELGERAQQILATKVGRRAIIRVGAGLGVAALLAACDQGKPAAAIASQDAKASAPATAVATAPARVDDKELQRLADEAHAKRLAELDPVFRKDGYVAWLKKAGFTFSDVQLTKEARQVEEETLSIDGGARILASGVQVDVKDLNAPWPNALTTTTAVAGTCVKPDPNNPSILCTDAKGFSGKATLYVDVQNWRGLTPKK